MNSELKQWKKTGVLLTLFFFCIGDGKQHAKGTEIENTDGSLRSLSIVVTYGNIRYRATAPALSHDLSWMKEMGDRTPRTLKSFIKFIKWWFYLGSSFQVMRHACAKILLPATIKSEKSWWDLINEIHAVKICSLTENYSRYEYTDFR